jgi:hypothetical protein
VELDAVRDLIVGGRVDPQVVNDQQAAQYRASARAACALAKSFDLSGLDVAVEEVFEPDVFRELWEPMLYGTDHRVVIVHPSLDETLKRSKVRSKDVWEEHTRNQHAACAQWPPSVRIDTTGLDTDASLLLADAVIDSQPGGFRPV